jgi:hypothetical protein
VYVCVCVCVHLILLRGGSGRSKELITCKREIEK